MLWQMLDSDVETTRIYWRMTYLGFTEAQARDPRPWAEIAREFIEANAASL